MAQVPLEERETSRLMVLDRETGDIEHKHFTDILSYLHEGDCLVLKEVLQCARLYLLSHRANEQA
ncbi:S-adenosylmethionine:tRNA ribosyltransferase-isomerase [Bacillus sp. HC-TM]